MGQAKARQLRAVATAAAGGPVVIELGERSARRLATMRAAAEGATLAAQAAASSAQQLQERYQEAVAGVLDANGVELTERSQVAHDADKGTLTVQTPVADGTPAAPPAAIPSIETAAGD